MSQHKLLNTYLVNSNIVAIRLQETKNFYYYVKTRDALILITSRKDETILIAKNIKDVLTYLLNNFNNVDYHVIEQKILELIS